MPVVAILEQRRRHVRALDRCLPAPGRQRAHHFLPDLDALLDEGERLLGVTPDAFDASPFTDLVRETARRSRGRRTHARRTGCSGCRSRCIGARTADWSGRVPTWCSAM